MAFQTVLILDFGGQYKELIARRVRENHVYSEVHPGNMSPEEIRKMNPIGIILTGGPDSVYLENAPKASPEIFSLGIPVLGICYGMQLLSFLLGGEVKPCDISEYGKTAMTVSPSSPLFKGLDEHQVGLMSHTDQVTVLPEGFRSIASSAHCPNAAIENRQKKIYGLQFHPEVESTPNGKEILHHFLYSVCHASGDYVLTDLKKILIDEVRQKVGKKHVLLALSGGVDSSVCAALLSEAIPGQLHCVFVDHGMMRYHEAEEVRKAFEGRHLDLRMVHAEKLFLEALKGVTSPEEKRKIIGQKFVEVFEKESGTLPDIHYLAQGTIYPDVIESGADKTATIKSHHNVGGLPSNLRFDGVVEPLRTLFKDEVRALGAELGLPKPYLARQPFPGPGLGVRIIGEITEEKVSVLQRADAIFREEVRKHRLKADQYFAVLTNTRSVGVVGDFRTYEYTLALRAVQTSDFMTCEVTPISTQLLGKISKRIINEVEEVGRVVYDVTSKPPATIEWE
ncbi:MAG: glutamine-hydrolyzing GMP synthase [Clostridia bacterium]|nr:glutamine-hydrolyzing GMP synthase [Clostridia bacterium]